MASASVADRRALRLALASALALALAYGLAFPLPFLAPLFVAFLSARPGPPLAARALLALLLVMVLSLGVGLLLIPLLVYFPLTALLVVFAGLYLAMYVTLILGKQMLGLFLTVGFTFISVAGSVSSALATAIIVSLGLAISTAVLCQWLVYPLLPEPSQDGTAAATGGEAASVSNWLALRAALIVMPAYLLALTNPSQYLMTIMKSVSLGQQATVVDVHHAGRELLGSTFAGGLLAVAFWALLSVHPTLWMFALWMAAAGLYVGCKLYGVLRTTVAPSFWVNALVTMLILLGPAVEDTAKGKDAVTAFSVRFATFIGVTLYAWVAIAALERWRKLRRTARVAS
mgnify:CR=1 FL=1